MRPEVRFTSATTAGALREALHALREGTALIVHDAKIEVDEGMVDCLVRSVDQPGVGSASPIPASVNTARCYDLHEANPPAPTLGSPCHELTALSGLALGSSADQLDAFDTPDSAPAEDLITEVGEHLLRSGWRHVGAPGLALAWQPADWRSSETNAAWTPQVAADLVGPANAGLEAHVSWANSRLDRLRLLVDGTCLTHDLHTGTQHLVIAVTRELRRLRPTAEVWIAVPSESIDAVRSMMNEPGVVVVDRSETLDVDVVYRPYQMLKPTELGFISAHGRRLLIGQLDMIGFSNPYYHPSPELFALARNLQRHLLRRSDGVTFISNYGRDAALAECPDLEQERLHLVSCGADPVPSNTPSRPTVLPADGLPFITCVSATFWHKNRCHAISTFARLVADHSYSGSLVIVGPEPYYGRSLDAEDALLETLPNEVRDRVHRLGRSTDDEKWWLLSHADAVLYPSVVEGFGLVPFEAAAVGTPCLSFAGTAQAELLGSTDATIDTWAPEHWAERVGTWITDPAEAARVVADVANVADAHTWAKCAERTWQAIDVSLALPRRPGGLEEGGVFSQIAQPVRESRVIGPRFFAARAVPAVRRRVQAMTANRRGAS